MHLVDGGAHVYIGHIWKAVDQFVVKAAALRCAVRSDIRHGQIRHLRQRVNSEKIGAHRGPINPPQRSDAGIHALPGDLETQCIAELEFQCFGNAFFHADGIRFVGHPASLHDLVMRRGLRAVRDIEFALDQAFGPLIRVIRRPHGFAVDLDQARAQHRVPVHFVHTGLVQGVQKRLRLVRLYVDDKAVRRVCRGGVAPTVDQIGTQQHQQQQGQQADRQRTDLHHGIAGPRADLARGHAQPGRYPAPAHRQTQALHRQPGQTGKHQHRSGKAADHHQTQRQVAAGVHQQSGKTRQT